MKTGFGKWAYRVRIIILLTAARPYAAQASGTNQAFPLETLARVPPILSFNDVMLSPDGRMFATLRTAGAAWHTWLAGQVYSLELWSVPKGTLLWTADAPVLRLLAFSPDGTRLLGVTGEGSTVLWDAATGLVKTSLQTVPPKANFGVFGQVVFLPDGRSLLAGVATLGGGIPPMAVSGAIQQWDTKTGSLLRTLPGQTNAVRCLAISAAGQELAAANDVNGQSSTVNLLDVASGELRRVMDFGSNSWWITSLAFSADGKTLASGEAMHDGTGQIRFWEVASGKVQRTLTAVDVKALDSRIGLGRTSLLR